jgi:hypothetical protein
MLMPMMLWAKTKNMYYGQIQEILELDEIKGAVQDSSFLLQLN